MTQIEDAEMRPLLFYIQCIRGNYYSFLFKITKAPITPGTQPQHVSNKTINTDPQPLSKTANGGKKIANKTLKTDIIIIIKWLISCAAEPRCVCWTLASEPWAVRRLAVIPSAKGAQPARSAHHLAKRQDRLHRKP